jgi:hypothetical protein
MFWRRSRLQGRAATAKEHSLHSGWVIRRACDLDVLVGAAANPRRYVVPERPRQRGHERAHPHVSDVFFRADLGELTGDPWLCLASNHGCRKFVSGRHGPGRTSRDTARQVALAIAASIDSVLREHQRDGP